MGRYIDKIYVKLKTLNKYGAGIRRLPLDDETAAVDNMVADVDKLDLTPLANTGLDRWNPLIKNANNTFKTAAREYIEDSALEAELEAAGKLAPSLVDALEGMYAMVMANLMVAHEGPFQKAYVELQELVGSFR